MEDITQARICVIFYTTIVVLLLATNYKTIPKDVQILYNHENTLIYGETLYIELEIKTDEQTVFYSNLVEDGVILEPTDKLYRLPVDSSLNLNTKNVLLEFELKNLQGVSIYKYSTIIQNLN